MHRILVMSHSSGSDCKQCQQQHPLQVTFNTMTNWSEGLLALNRLMAIWFPVQFRIFNKNFVQSIALFCCWLSILAMAVPPAVDVGGTYRMSPIGTCVMLPNNVLILALFVVNAYCPMVLIAVAAVVIIFKFAGESRLSRCRSVFPVAPTAEHHSTGQRSATPGYAMSERQKRISKMLMITFVFNWTCQLPTYIAIIVGISERQPILAMYFSFLSILQFSATPVCSEYVRHDGCLWDVKRWFPWIFFFSKKYPCTRDLKKTLWFATTSWFAGERPSKTGFLWLTENLNRNFGFRQFWGRRSVTFVTQNSTSTRLTSAVRNFFSRAAQMRLAQVSTREDFRLIGTLTTHIRNPWRWKDLMPTSITLLLNSELGIFPFEKTGIVWKTIIFGSTFRFYKRIPFSRIAPLRTARVLHVNLIFAIVSPWVLYRR